MSKASIKASIAQTNSALSAANGKLANLEAALATVRGTKTTISYKLTGDYHLEGDKYDELTEDEKELLKNLQRDMLTKKETVEGKLKTAIASEQTTISSLNGNLISLFKQLEYAKD